jgi:hypothetical protein
MRGRHGWAREICLLRYRPFSVGWEWDGRCYWPACGCIVRGAESFEKVDFSAEGRDLGVAL